MTYKLLLGDCLDELEFLPDESVDSIVTDPPYHLTNNGGGPHNKTPNAYSRAQAGAKSTGFMGQTWDGGDIAFNSALWRECLRVLKPGGHLLAFGGSRTYHRMACAVEDGGFEIRDQIMWVFGSGFPKSHNGEWGGTALKPAHEPIVLARKRLAGTVEANWREHGTGALNIDGCRVGDEVRFNAAAGNKSGDNSLNMSVVGMPQDVEGRTAIGRWPANLIHDGGDEVLAGFPQSPGQQADVSTTAPSKKTRNVYGPMNREGELSADSDNAGIVGFKMKPGQRRLDAGSAARFFYCAKASRADRNSGLNGMAKKDLNWSSGTQSPGTFQSKNTDRSSENYHPTVKPTSLMRYLCRLITPAGGTVLDPFMGSGSTGIAAILEGFKFIGIEKVDEYCQIAKARIDFAIGDDL